MPVETVLYVGQARASGGREGRAHTDDHVLDVKLTMPRELGGNGAPGANPEQLFAAGYSACFLGALNFVANQQRQKLPAEASVEGRVGIGPIPTGFGIEAELRISLPGLDRALAEDLVRRAHVVCPYSNATQGNINVTLTLL
ncbi:organic hydroperoxide resistance protein [Caulobacter sp. FWC26]|uniref:organic hydroperoxide resistance protein n=1 Tax=Caulobacter sp. FWC26 TaxID=69665 RepID=UPI000C159146|nr:organic hydroperoxide resistance protein [Caulobacter sp. FWC26]AZS19216.1 organic hydroperoxide resistance protein [Caulobacter sp. FWC26]